MSPTESPTRRRSAAPIAALLLLLVLATGCNGVLMVGDSVMVGTGPVADAKFSATGWAPRHDGRVGRKTDEGLEVIRTLSGGYDVVVVELGYNDAWHPDYGNRIRTILDELSNRRRVVVVTMNEVQPFYVTGNRILRSEAAARSNVRIADWAAVAASTPGLTLSDGVHLTTAGNQRLAQLIYDTVTAP